MRKFKRQELQSDRALELGVFSLEHHSHAPPADFAADPVFVCEKRPFSERLDWRDEGFSESGEIIDEGC
jgi:hypothetical protein